MSDGHAACSQAPVSESPLRIVAAVSGPATRVRRDAGICRWSSNLSYAIRHIEGEPETLGGKGQRAKVAKFQFRPDPLAKQERGPSRAAAFLSGPEPTPGSGPAVPRYWPPAAAVASALAARASRSCASVRNWMRAARLASR